LMLGVALACGDGTRDGEGTSARLHPGNHHVREKIRQRLQVLRDLGLLEFHGDGHYSLR